MYWGFFCVLADIMQVEEMLITGDWDHLLREFPKTQVVVKNFFIGCILAACKGDCSA